jgi:2-oxoisovalerate dehydrogenase E1 component
MMGRVGGVCQGRGGSQHLCKDLFFSNGIQGAGCLQAVGFSWAQKLRGDGYLTVAQLGDGTLGQGAVYEAMNFAALLKVPVLFLIEYNGWAQSTDVHTTIAGTIEGRARAFGLPVDRKDDLNTEELSAHLGQVLEMVRTGQPFVQIIETHRLLAHSKGDDNRPRELIEAQFTADPLHRWLATNPELGETLSVRVNQRLDNCIAEVSGRPFVDGLGAAAIPDLANVPDGKALLANAGRNLAYGTVVQELNAALHAMMDDDPRVIVLGEDIADPYGGAFKVTQGLSTAFGRRTFSTPIAEGAIVGVSAGAALAGRRPVAEIMFADFVTLSVDQLVNSAAKFHYMFGGKVSCPLTVRLVSGGRRGYGPTHSQSTERLLCGEPGLRVVALSSRHDPAALLRHVVCEDDAPTVFVEDKSLYSRKPKVTPPLGMSFKSVRGTPESYPPLVFCPEDEAAKVTVVTYGASVELAEAALERLLVSDEEYGDLVILTQLWPLDIASVLHSLSKTHRLLVIEPHVATYGIGAAVVCAAAEALGGGLSVRTIGARPYPIPSARHLEDMVLPTVGRVYDALKELMGLP